MKKQLFKITFLFLLVGTIQAQVTNPNQPLEVDKSVRTGKLENGLTYYIKQNHKPENCADFWLVTNVGAIQETKEQDGLAHFLEHMAFNGTKNFPGKSLFTYFEGNGAKFGTNINASTGIEQTAYMLNNINLKREGILDSSLLVLHDWAAFITLDPKEIDAERGVIIEEWRTRNIAQIRTWEKSNKIIQQGSKYASCNIIGTKENLESFKPEELVNFYKTWYRPDLQAIIIVGDVNPEAVESKIKTLFGDIPTPTTPNPKKAVPVVFNKDLQVGVIGDKELTNSSFQIVVKSAPLPTEVRTMGIGQMINLSRSIIGIVLNERARDISSKPNAPILSGYSYINELNNQMDGFTSSIRAKEGEESKALDLWMTELERVKRYGFTSAELNRAKEQILSSLESRAKSAESRENREFVRGYQSHFIDGWPYMTPEYELTISKGFLAMIPDQAINQMIAALLPEENRTVILSAPIKEGLTLPSETELSATIQNIKTKQIEAPVQEAIASQLIDPQTIQAGKIVKETPDNFGSTLLTLSNGTRVYLKPTELRKDEIVISAYGSGGKSLLTDEMFPSVDGTVVGLYNSFGGAGDFPKPTLDKILAGKNVFTYFSISDYEHTISGRSTTKDLETWMQLCYLKITQPRFQADELAPMMENVKSQVINRFKDPRYIFSVNMLKSLYGNNPQMQLLSPETLEKVRLENLEKAYRQMFGNANGMTFFVVGDFKVETIKPLLEQYIASLPAKEYASVYIDRNIRTMLGKGVNKFETEMQTPKTTVAHLYTGTEKQNKESMMLMNALSLILDIKYVKSIREEQGGTYGVMVGESLSNKPVPNFMLRIQFDTDPNKAELLADIAKKEIQQIIENGVSDEIMNKVREALINRFKNEWSIYNGYWSAVLKEWDQEQINAIDDYEQRASSLTSKMIQEFTARLISQDNLLEVVMNPKQ
ncbi:MAG: M16 family metallopeptidase [Bacteroidales bacterium]